MIVHSFWFSMMYTKDPVGIIWDEDEVTKEIRAYIGIGYGKDKAQDERLIREDGSPLNIPFLYAEDQNVMKGKIRRKIDSEKS